LLKEDPTNPENLSVVLSIIDKIRQCLADVDSVMKEASAILGGYYGAVNPQQQPMSEPMPKPAASQQEAKESEAEFLSKLMEQSNADEG